MECSGQPSGLNVSECMPPYSVGVEEKEPFGPWNGTEHAWTWRANTAYPFEYQTKLHNWDGDGFWVDLPSNYSGGPPYVA